MGRVLLALHQQRRLSCCAVRTCPTSEQSITCTVNPNVRTTHLQMMVDWTVPNLTVKAAVALTNQPKVDLAVTTGRMDYVLGAAALYDSATGNVSTWSVGAGYTGLDYQV